MRREIYECFSGNSGEKYNYKIGYRDDELLRRSFNELAEKTSGIVMKFNLIERITFPLLSHI